MDSVDTGIYFLMSKNLWCSFLPLVFIFFYWIYDILIEKVESESKSDEEMEEELSTGCNEIGKCFPFFLKLH